MKYLEKKCPICGYSIAKSFFDSGEKTLSTIVWAESKQEAITLEKYNQEYIQCLNCTHIWNHLFDWNEIPYDKKSNKMFNNGSNWKKHLNYLGEWLSEKLTDKPTIIEIGCGNGHFLQRLSSFYKGNFIGFDPSGDINESDSSITFYKSLFEPKKDIPKYKPNLIIMRHLLEHLSEPSSFLQSMSWAVHSQNIETYLFCEVPCIDKVFETARISDFYYEHPSQFSAKSFITLMKSCGEIIDIKKLYGGEVICGLIKLKPKQKQLDIDLLAEEISKKIASGLTEIPKKLSYLVSTGKRIAIWGGTGKCAAFMHHYNVSEKDFPIVVDSDSRKVGTFVPGVGQEILPAKYLIENPVEILIIPTQWRAKDILKEADSLNLNFELVLIEHNGKLLDFYNSNHPY